MSCGGQRSTLLPGTELRSGFPASTFPCLVSYIVDLLLLLILDFFHSEMFGGKETTGSSNIIKTGLELQNKPASTSKALGLEAQATMPCLGSAEDRTQDFVHATQVLYHLNLHHSLLFSREGPTCQGCPG